MEFTTDDLMMELTLRSFLEQIHAFVDGRAWGAQHGVGVQQIAGALEGLVRILAERPRAGRVEARSVDTGVAKSTGTGSISGTVTREGTPTALEGIEVQVFDVNGSWAGNAATDASGNYVVGGLGTGTYFAMTYKAGDIYIDELYVDTVCFNSWSCPITTGTPISVTDAVETAGIDFGLEVGGYITGNVVDEDTWLGLVTSTAVTAVDKYGVIVSSAMAGTPNGKYFVYGLPTGDYFVLAASSGYVSEVHEDIPIYGWISEVFAGTPVHVVQGDVGPTVLFYLAPAGSIEGTVAESGTGTPIPGAFIGVYDAAGASLPGFVSSDGTGAFTKGQLPSGSYYVTCTTNTYLPVLWDGSGGEVCVGCDVTTGEAIVVTQPDTESGIDFVLEEKGGRILGTVTVEGSPSTKIENAIINVFDGSGTPLDAGISIGNGTYETFGTLPTGSYTVTASHSDYITEVYEDMECFPCWNPTSIPPVTVDAPDDTTGIDFSLSPGGAVEGTVTVEGSVSPINVGVTLYDSGGNAVASAGPWEGDYTASGLPTGTYYATAQGAQSGLGLQGELFDDILCLYGSCDVLTGNSISVTSPTTTSNVDFDLLFGGRFAGRVTDASTGIPLVTGIRVDVYDSGGVLVGSTPPSTYGLYSTEGLATGTYYALARDTSSAGYASELYDGMPCDGCDVTTGTAIVISSTDTYGGIDFSLSVPAVCTVGETHLNLTSTSPVSVTKSYEACETITAGGTFGVESPGDVALHAGMLITLTNGFFVENGATATFEIDPGLIP
jgi:hypothetical protein